MTGSFISSIMRLSAAVSPPSITSSTSLDCPFAMSLTILGYRLNMVERGIRRIVRIPSSSFDAIKSSLALSSLILDFRLCILDCKGVSPYAPTLFSTASHASLISSISATCREICVFVTVSSPACVISMSRIFVSTRTVSMRNSEGAQIPPSPPFDKGGLGGISGCGCASKGMS